MPSQTDLLGYLEREPCRHEHAPPLAATHRTASPIWRIEIRAGKDLLKDGWHIRRWPELEAQFGEVMAEALENIRSCRTGPQEVNRPAGPIIRVEFDQRRD